MMALLPAVKMMTPVNEVGAVVIQLNVLQQERGAQIPQ